MAMYLHTGVPGAGKTYLMIAKFVKLFCDFNSETQLYEMKPKHRDKILISNIEGLKLPHLDLVTEMNERSLLLAKKKYIEETKDFKLDDMEDVITEFYDDFRAENIRWFFNYPYQKRLTERYGNIIYLIEESQNFFDGKEIGRQKWVRSVSLYFEKHRHIGATIFMDTQHASKLAKGISVLFESETRAKPRTFSVFGEFKYNEYSDGTKINQVPIVKKPDKNIFGAYTSMSTDEVVKPKKPIFKLLVFVLCVGAVGFFVLSYAKGHLGGRSVEASTLKSNEVVKKKNVSVKKNGSVPITGIGNIPKIKKNIVWKRLSFVKCSRGIVVLNPVSNSVMLLKDLKLKVRRQGNNLFVQVPR